MRHRISVVPLVALLSTVSAAAAQNASTVDVLTRAGLYAPQKSLGAVARAVGPWLLELEKADAGASLELAAEFAWPGQQLRTRVLGLATLPLSARGQFVCAPGHACPSVLLPTSADVSVYAAVADLVWVPVPHATRVRPYLAFGAGLRHHRISWDAAAVLVPGGKDADNVALLHGGVGFDFELFGLGSRIEIGDYFTPAGADWEGTGNNTPGRDGRAAQHDVTATFGIRLLRF